MFLNVRPVAPKIKGEFATIDTVLSNTDYRSQILRNALKELRNFQRKYAAYKELANVSKAIDDFADSLT